MTTQPVEDLAQSLLREYGPMRVHVMRLLLKLRYGVEIEDGSLSQTLFNLYRQKLVTKTATAKFCLVGDQQRSSAIPDIAEIPVLSSLDPGVAELNESYLRLLLRWQAVRANPDLLELTDEMIDNLYLLN